MYQITCGSEDNTRGTELSALPSDVLKVTIPTTPDLIYRAYSQEVRGVSFQKRRLLAQLVTNTKQRQTGHIATEL